MKFNKEVSAEMIDDNCINEADILIMSDSNLEDTINELSTCCLTNKERNLFICCSCPTDYNETTENKCPHKNRAKRP